MRAALLGLAFLAVASAMHIPAGELQPHKRFWESLSDKIKDLLPSQEDIDKLKGKLEDAKDSLKDKLEGAKDKIKDTLADAKDKMEDAKTKLDEAKGVMKDKLEDVKEKLGDAKDSISEKIQNAKDKLKEALDDDEEKSEQKRFWKDWVDKIKEVLPSKTDIEKLKDSITGVFPAVNDAAAGEIKDLFKSVEDQTKAVNQFKDLFENLDNEDTLIDNFGKLYPYNDENGKFIGVKNWVSNAVAKVQEYYKDYVPADILEKIEEVKEAAADKDDKRRLPSAVLKLFCELLQMVGLLVINYAIGLPLPA